MNDHEWDKQKILALFEMPLFDLINNAYILHKTNFPMNQMELCVLSSIKTGSCPEDCAYCPQSAHYDTGLKKNSIIDDKDSVIDQIEIAKKNGATRFCVGAAWRSPPKKDFDKVTDLIRLVKSSGLEACATLGMLDENQANQLKDAGLDYYNHNLDTSRTFYQSIISTRNYDDRLRTINHVINAGINVCCGGILGMGESQDDRIHLLLELSRLPVPPKSIPINKLIKIKNTPLEHSDEIETFDFIRTIAVSRLMFPSSKIRLSAGRESMSDEFQAWCFMAGANSIFIGDKLLTAKNSNCHDDMNLLNKLGINVLSL